MMMDNLPTIETPGTNRDSVQELFATIENTTQHTAPIRTDSGIESKADDVKQKKSKKPMVIAAIVVVCLLAAAGVAYAVFGGKKEPVAEEIQTMQATVKANGVFIEALTLKRGDKLANIEPANDLNAAFAKDYYKAECNGKTIYIEKKWVRTANEEAPAECVRYAKENAILYENVSFSGKELSLLPENSKLTILDSFGGILFVRNEEGLEGYLPEDAVSEEETVKDDDSGGSTGYSYSYYYGYSGDSGSYGGGGTGGGGSYTPPAVNPPFSPSTPTDGEEITMPTAWSPANRGSIFGPEYAFADEPSSSAKGDSDANDAQKNAGTASGTASSGTTGIVLGTGAHSYYTILNRGDEVTVKLDDLYRAATGASAPAGATDSGKSSSSKDAGAANTSAPSPSASASASAPSARGSSEEAAGTSTAQENTAGKVTLVINGQEALIDFVLLRMQDQAAYSAWEGYACEGAVGYANYVMTAEACTYEINDEVSVVDEIGNVLVVEKDDNFVYIAKDKVSKTKLEEEEDEVEAGAGASGSQYSAYSYSYSDEGGYSSGESYSGGSGSGDSGGSSNPGGSSSQPEWSKPTL